MSESARVSSTRTGRIGTRKPAGVNVEPGVAVGAGVAVATGVGATVGRSGPRARLREFDAAIVDRFRLVGWTTPARVATSTGRLNTVVLATPGVGRWPMPSDP